MKVTEVLGISGGFTDPSPRDPRTGLPIGSLADEYGWIKQFPPWERPIITDEHAVELQVEGYPERRYENEPHVVVTVTLWRCKCAMFERTPLYRFAVPLSSLCRRPELVTREVSP